MSGQRVQEPRECHRIYAECSWVEDGEECPAPGEHCIGEPGERIGDESPCDGCDGNGTRWVSVGTLACGLCSEGVDWIICPTGGWWAHVEHPADGHDADRVYVEDADS